MPQLKYDVDRKPVLKLLASLIYRSDCQILMLRLMKWILFVSAVAVAAVRTSEHLIQKHDAETVEKVEKIDPCCRCTTRKHWFRSRSSCRPKTIRFEKYGYYNDCPAGSALENGVCLCPCCPLC